MSEKKDQGFSGLWPALFTPVDKEGKLVQSSLEKLIELQISQGVDGIYLLGSTGQGFLFNEEERKKIAAASLEIVNGRLPVMVQVGALSSQESVRLARHASLHGADGISSVGPIYYGATTAMVINHYRMIANASNLPFYPYQIGNGIMNEEVIVNLLSISNVAGLKLTTQNLLEISNIRNRVGESWRLFSGADELMCQAAMCGTNGAIGTTYNLLGAAFKHVRAEFLNGNVELGIGFMLRFQSLIEKIMPVIWAFFDRAMELKHGIAIGAPKAPLLAPALPWTDEEVLSMVNDLEKFAFSKNASITV